MYYVIVPITYHFQKTLGTRSNDARAFSLGSILFYGPVINSGIALRPIWVRKRAVWVLTDSFACFCTFS